QIVQVGLHTPEQRIIFYAVFAPAVLPALTLMAKLPGRNYMLPLQPRAALSVFARCVATTTGINLLAAEGAITIKGIRMVSINLCRQPFGFVEIGRPGLGLNQQGKQCETTTQPAHNHGEIRSQKNPGNVAD